MRAVALAAFLLAAVAGRAFAQDAFSFAPWRTVAPAPGWTFSPADFDADGDSDLVGYYTGNGSLWVLDNQGGSFGAAQYAVISPTAGWQIEAGDFTGDALPDVFGYHPSNGTLWVGANTGTAFSFTIWGTVTPSAGWRFSVGDFTGDGALDVLGYDASSGQLRVGANTGTSFAFTTWSTVGPASGWTFAAGDFDGDGALDVAGHHANQTLWMGRNTGAGFSFAQWGTLAGTGWSFSQLVAGELTGDGAADLIGYSAPFEDLVVGVAAGDRFLLRKWGDFAPGSSFVAGRFTGPPEADLLAYTPASGVLAVGDNVQPPKGYVWPLSAAPGETLAFHVSGRGSSDVIFLRHRADAAGLASTPMGATTFSPEPRSEPAFAYRDGCGWPESFAWTIPEGWPSGIYSARFTDRFGATSDVTFVVKPAPAERSTVAVLANVNTWNAYNDWGGKSKYHGAADLSFLRPNPQASPVIDDVPPGGWSHPHHLTRGELWPITWLEDAGWQPDVYSDVDFHEHGLPSGYRTLVLTTHPEYWSVEMYDQLVAFLAGGGSLLYLGGNGIYEPGEYIAGGTAMRFIGGVEGANRDAFLFRRTTSPPRPERSVLGVATERCGVTGHAYTVTSPLHPILQCAGASGVFGTSGLNRSYDPLGRAAALETDTSSGPGAVGEAIGCGGSALSTPPSALPAGLEVLARADVAPGVPGAELVYYDHPGGGLVLSAGSITFGGSLPVDPAIQGIVQCALEEAETRPDPQCGNGLDDDADGAIDWPADDGCTSAADATERFDCEDGVDNDADGLVDHPDDPGCAHATGKRENPQCSNGADDDDDGAIDWPADTKCRGPADNDELSNPACGGGAELLLVAAGLLRSRSRRRR
ncbi:MAG: hypothetical protein DCC71_01630 [Proteobacteria bacterium]|nr:MAG: hypothetical protein DCC71_01630 [Pseudomonadota bacterium]